MNNILICALKFVPELFKEYTPLCDRLQKKSPGFLLAKRIRG